MKKTSKRSAKSPENASWKTVSVKQLKKVLRETDEKYRTLTENVTIGIYKSPLGPKDHFMEVNAAFVKMLGYKNKKELYSIEVGQIYLDSENWQRLIDKISKKGSLKNEELYLKKKDGKAITVSQTLIPVKDKKGKMVYFYGVVQDITRSKKAEEELLIKNTYLERLYNSAPEAIVLHDNNDLIADVNAEFIRMFGYSREEAIGKPINDLVASSEFLDEAADISQRVIRGERIDLDTKRKRKDGTLIDVSVLGAPIIHNGKQIGDYAIYRDITQRKKAEEDLYIQTAYLERLFNSAPEAIILHDNNDKIINVNAEFTKMFGYTREEAIGKSINDLVASEEFKDEAAGLSNRVINGQRVEIDTKRKRKNGMLMDVWIVGAPIIHEGKQMGVYAIYRDITERKKAEETRIRHQEEARMARNIQVNFLPKSNPKIQHYDIVGKSIPASNVGGDYYDFIFLDDHRLVICLGDVSGNGLAAALVMANLQATIRSQALSGADPDKCLERANTLLYRSTDARTFVSLFYAILDTRKHTLKYANAGQDLPLLFSLNNRPFPLQESGIALGMIENVSYKCKEVAINRGDRLLIYSDGIREAMNEYKEEFGDEKLKQIVQRNGNVSAKVLIKKIITVVNAHFGNMPQNDDMTLVILKRK
jgi:sigma-B regulation protein RsbU (phosphoserine phosphatase)